uniref:Putative licpodalin-4 1 n=1 Tax=Amblyomma triste TaxID=251400 RepID=A0A023G9W2_AMBTT
MNFNLALLVSIIASAAAWHYYPGQEGVPKPALPIPSVDPNAQDLDIRRVVEVNERLAVIRRKHNVGTSYRCLSALKQSGSGTGPYKYNLKARNGIHTEDKYEDFKVEVTLKPLGVTTPGYKATYMQKGKEITLTLKNADQQNKCFVLFADYGQNQGGCELLLRKSALSQDIPADCLSYYENQCGGVSIQLYEEGCKYEDVPELVPIEGVPGIPF